MRLLRTDSLQPYDQRGEEVHMLDVEDAEGNRWGIQVSQLGGLEVRLIDPANHSQTSGALSVMPESSNTVHVAPRPRLRR